MTWQDIARDLLLVLSGGFVSIATTLLIQEYAERQKRKEISRVLLQDIKTQLGRLSVLAKLSSDKPDTNGFDKGKARYDIAPFDRTIYNSVAQELPKLSDKVFNKIMLFYSSMSLFDDKISGAASKRDQMVLLSALVTMNGVYILGCEAIVIIQEEIVKNRREAREYRLKSERIRAMNQSECFFFIANNPIF